MIDDDNCYSYSLVRTLNLIFPCVLWHFPFSDYTLGTEDTTACIKSNFMLITAHTIYK